MSKNPFMFWGSYVGLIVGVVAAYFSFAVLFDAAERGVFNYFYLLIPLGLVVGGFWVGFRVHRWLRGNRKIY